MKTTLARTLPGILLAGLVGPVVLASSASAAPTQNPHPTASVLGAVVRLLQPPPAPAPSPTAAAAPAAAATQPTAAAATPTAGQVEHKLAELRYDVGPADGDIDAQAASAIIAFQKVHGLERTGRLTDPLATQIMATQGTPAPVAPNGEPNRVEVDLARQVLFLYEGGSLTKILPVSTGTSETPTPTGSFRFYRYDPGWHTSRLGRLYNAEYFFGGYAIHGSLSVPAHPASHGCIRIPMSAAEWFPSHAAKGMQVVVVKG